MSPWIRKGSRSLPGNVLFAMLPVLSLAVLSFLPGGSDSEGRGDIRFVFYNTENLFDTYDDPAKIDEEFLPWGIKGWNRERYEDKLHKIFKVMVNIGGWELPDLIGLCEIENRAVLEDLLNKTPLSREKYGIIHEDSPDARGIDVGFLYRRDKFLPIEHEAIHIDLPDDSVTTRDILRIKGALDKRDTVHIFICHFPSKRGGQAVSEPKRIYVAGVLRAKVDSLLAADPDAAIIITGDFNDEPLNISIHDVLKAGGNWNEMDSDSLYNFMYRKQADDGRGSYKYGGFWDMLDQFIVSKGLMEGRKGIYVSPSSGQIYEAPWLLEEDPEAPGMKPFRTYGGAYYYGGYSDHLPIYLDIYFNKKR